MHCDRTKHWIVPRLVLWAFDVFYLSLWQSDFAAGLDVVKP
jgi:hypothetical protein